MSEPAASLDEIRALVAHLPGPDLEAGTAAAARERQLTKPAGALGRLEELAAWLATWQARHPPRLDHPRTVVFAANHGVAARGVSAYPPVVTAQMVQNFVAGGAAINQLCRTVDADLRVYEMDLEAPTADIVEAPAMSEEECARAVAYGMMAVEPGIDALAVGEMGIANTTVAAALCMGLFGGDAMEWTGPGTGVVGAALERKREVVAAAVARHRPAATDPFDMLRRLGGLEFAAMAGAILAARMGRVPVVLDGFSAGAAAAVLYAADPRALDHCVAGHVSAEPGHRLLLERIGKRPLLDLGMRLGEASGATLALFLLKAAVACHAGMAKFVIAPHMRLHEWVARDKGYFDREGLDYEFRDQLASPTGRIHDLGDKVGAYQTFERGRDSNVNCACHWTVNVAASVGHGKLYPHAYSVAPAAVFVPPESDITDPAQLAGVPISVGYQSGSHYATIQALEQYLKPEEISLSFADGLLFRRMELLIDRQVPAASLFSGPYYFLEQLGFRKVIDSTFMMASMITGDPDPEDVRKYFRALRSAQRDIDLRPERYTHYYREEFPSRFRDMMDTRRWGPGERLVFEPYTKAAFDEARAWIAAHGIFAPTEMGPGLYEEAILSVPA